VLKTFADLSTPLVADACIRLDVPLRAAPPGITAVIPGHRIAGRALPARHYGSVDVFLEAFAHAERGDVLVVDNGGRTDEACVGDLAVLEAEAAGLAGLVRSGSGLAITHLVTQHLTPAYTRQFVRLHREAARTVVRAGRAVGGQARRRARTRVARVAAALASPRAVRREARSRRASQEWVGEPRSAAPPESSVRQPRVNATTASLTADAT
jgi:hypothetical protein